jgi:hypothetical protein
MGGGGLRPEEPAAEAGDGLWGAPEPCADGRRRGAVRGGRDGGG